VTHLKAMTSTAKRDGLLESRDLESRDEVSVRAPSPRARPVSLQESRAGLWRCLARDPTVSRSVGLVL
jgi:hypothetical protein